VRGLRLDQFADAVGECWNVEAGGAFVPLRLDVAEPLPVGMRTEGSFRLEWLGPADALLPQAIYTFRRDGEAAEMFIVPVAREGAEIRYEAIFS
jgi:hypothetical protein